MEKNASILVVDDDKEIADLVEIYLVNDGYQVLKASDGEQCLETLKQHPEVRMLILDIMMPGIDGLEVCREIRKTSNIPILILSAKAEDMDKIVGFGTGADDYEAISSVRASCKSKVADEALYDNTVRRRAGSGRKG